MGTVYDKLVDQAEAMVNIINKKYVAGNRMAYLALLSGVGSCRIESYPGAGHNYQAVVDAMTAEARFDSARASSIYMADSLYKATCSCIHNSIAKNNIRNSPSTQEACPRSLVFRCRYSFFINFISFPQPAMNLQYNVISVSRRI